MFSFFGCITLLEQKSTAFFDPIQPEASLCEGVRVARVNRAARQQNAKRS
jgi:hypothetical protein